MAQQTPMTTSFNGGELSPLMVGRTDTAIYAIGVERMENFSPAIEGPMQKCPGFRRIRAAMASSTWLTRFVFNNTQAYVLEGGEGKLRFYTNGGRIETDADTPLEVTVPYAAAEWPRVSTDQSYDRLYMAHGQHQQATLTRTGATTFSYDPLELQNGPFNDGNSDRSATVQVTGSRVVGGTAIITASAAIFRDGHVGGLFQCEANDFSSIPAWEVGIDGNVSGTTQRRSDGKVYRAASSGRTGSVQPTHEEGTEWDGSSAGTDINSKGPYGVKWTYLYDRFGIIRIDTVYSDGFAATGTVLRRIPDSLGSVPSWRWAHGAFSDAEGWPDLVCTWNGRLCFWRGFDLFASVVGDYPNFQQYTSGGYLAADLAFRFRLAAADPPIWVAIDRDMIVATASGEFVIGAVNAAAAPSSTNIGARAQSDYGVDPVWPAAPGTSVVFVQRGGKQLREAQYDFSRDRYVSSNINRWARHIGRPGMIQLGVQQETEELIFAVRADGQLVLRSYDPEQEVKGFSRRVLAQGGKVLSAVSIPSEDGSIDEIWALCEWDGAKSVQQMTPWWIAGSALTDAFFVDDGLDDTLDEASATISGLGHLIGKTVRILADGATCPDQIVPDTGIITLPFAAKRRVVGRGYRAQMTALRAEVRDPSGQTAQGKKKRLVNLILRLLDTAGILANAGNRDQPLLARPLATPMGTPPPLFSGDTPMISLPGEWGRDGRYDVISDDALPCFVIATMPRFEVSER